MKEIEYIKATDLAKIRMAEQILRDVLPAINDDIPEEEYQEVIRYLAQRLFECKEIKDSEE